MRAHAKIIVALASAGSFAFLFGLAAMAETVVPASKAAPGIPVAQVTIYPGDEITEDMIYMKPPVGGKSWPGGVARELSSAVGRVARRTLIKGEPIPLSALRSKQDVVQGRQYKLLYQGAFLEIAAPGVAQQSAAVGEIINVRNADTGVVVRARIAPDRTLVVEGP